MKSIKDWTVLDSGATSHFLVTAATTTNITPASSPITAKLPDGVIFVIGAAVTRKWLVAPESSIA